MTMTACGGNVDTTEIEETTVAEESTEAEEQEKAEVEAKAAEAKTQELGNIDANFYLGVLADWYGYPEEDMSQACAYYEQCEDNPYAQVSLGFLYYYSYGVIFSEDNEEKGKKIFQSVIDHIILLRCMSMAMARHRTSTQQ